MPNARNLTKLSVVINSVYDPIRPKEDLAKIVIPVFRNDATYLWKFLRRSVSEISSYPKDIARFGLSRAMKTTIS